MSTMHYVQQALGLYLKLSAADHFERATWRPAAAQEQKLLSIVRRNQATAFGREHDFARIRSVRDFQTRVPPRAYEGLEPYIARMRRGEPNVLTAERPLMFATTSGTTGRSKYIPVTPSYLREYAHGVAVHTYRCFADYPDLLAGKLVVSTSSDVEGHTEAGIPYGAISGYLSRTQPKAIRRFYALPYALCQVKAVDQKYYLTLRHALPADVRSLVTPNPSSLLLLADKLAAFADELIDDIRRGTVNPRYLPAGASAALTAGLTPDPRRADELATILRHDGRLTPAAAWPNLRLICCWKGGTMPLYLRRLPAVFGDCAVRDLGYMASEGRAASPLVNAGASGVINLTSHFFEFVRVEERDRPAPEFLTCDQLESNREYYAYFTTSAGLYRYDINDVVRVVDSYRETPVIQFIRKGGGVSSITGEKLTESQVTAALVEAVEARGLAIEHVTAGVEWGAPPRYAFYAELPAGLTAAAGRAFLAAIDQALCASNQEYADKRASQRLGAPALKRVAPGAYEALRQRRVAEGAPESQVKIPHLTTDLSFGERVTVLETIESGGNDR